VGQPNQQEYRNPWKWGWYYVSLPENETSGLMSRRAARSYIRKVIMTKWSHGAVLHRHGNAPRFRFMRRISFPILPLPAE
jgi:hypothetical protein